MSTLNKKECLWLRLYPIGAIYIGKNNPQKFMGGVWEQVKEFVFIRIA